MVFKFPRSTFYERKTRLSVGPDGEWDERLNVRVRRTMIVARVYGVFRLPSRQPARSDRLSVREGNGATLPGRRHVNDRCDRGNVARRNTPPETAGEGEVRRFCLKRNAGCLPDIAPSCARVDGWRNLAVSAVKGCLKSRKTSSDKMSGGTWEITVSEVSFSYNLSIFYVLNTFKTIVDYLLAINWEIATTSSFCKVHYHPWLFHHYRIKWKITEF